MREVIKGVGLAKKARITSRIGIVLAVLFFVSILSPQINYFGRGARTSVVLFGLWCVATGGLSVLFRRCCSELTLMVIFLVVLTLNWRLRPGQVGAGSMSFFGSLYVMMIFTIIAFYAVRQRDRLPQIRWWTFILCAAAVLPSIPRLFQEPGLPRQLQLLRTSLLLQNSNVAMGQSLYALLGVGTYELYSSLGIVVPCAMALLNWGRLWQRLVLGGSVAVVALTVMLSSFTMATVVLLVGMMAMFIGIPFLMRRWYRWLAVLGSVVFVGAFVMVAGQLAEHSESFQFVVAKTGRLLGGFAQSGFVEGDETGRGVLFMQSLQTFLRYPLLGSGFDATSENSFGGHSSLIDPWAQFGLLGYGPFCLLQVMLTWRVVVKWLASPHDTVAFGSAIAWMLFWASGVLNPTIFVILPKVLIFTEGYAVSAVRVVPRRHVRVTSIRPLPPQHQLVRRI